MSESNNSRENINCEDEQLCAIGRRNMFDVPVGVTNITEDVPAVLRGLKRVLPTAGNDFITARDILGECSPIKKNRTGSKNRNKLTVQSNTLLNYFKPVSKPDSAATDFVQRKPKPDPERYCQNETKSDSMATNVIKIEPNPDAGECSYSETNSHSSLKRFSGKSSQVHVNQTDERSQGKTRQVSELRQATSRQGDEQGQATEGRVDESLQSSTAQIDENNITWLDDNDDDDIDFYGLLGTGCPKGAEVSHFKHLPVEAIGNIFCHIPYVDLCLTLTHVCKSWNNIITRPLFLKWRKTYLCLRRDAHGKKRELLGLMEQNGMDVNNPDSALLKLMRYMKNIHPLTTFNMNVFLSKHQHYTQALEIVRSQLPECVQDQESCCWSVVACLVILSKYVTDIQSIMRYLTLSGCTKIDITECLYCMASFLFVFKSICYDAAWTGIHYRIYYALYLFENDSSVTCQSLNQATTETSGQQSIVRYGLADSSLKYTHEQLRICNHNLRDGEIIKIVAFAGTGKTTTLIRYTQLRPSTKFLLLVYNKATQIHCAKHFPSNVTCKTIHSVARGSRIGRSYANKIGNLHVSDVVSVLPWKKGENAYEHAGLVTKTINNFLSSADDSISLAHVPFEVMDRDGIMRHMETERRESVLRDALEIWRRATNPCDLSIKLSHDGYLKLYQLAKPHIIGYDVILIDEAQDQTSAVIDIIIQQRQPKILVGDPHQQIYSFRGAVNAMDMIPATTTYYLTQSFRFGSQIAFMANCCLEVLKNVHTKTLVGSNSQDTINESRCRQYTIISRTNYQLFSEAVNLCCYRNDNIKIAFNGGVNSFGFDVILDIYFLSLSPADRGQHRIRNRLISKFSSVSDLLKFARSTCDQELLSKITIVNTYNNLLPFIIQSIKSKTVDDVYFADVILSTAHKSKGLEFSSVVVTDDFMSNVFQRNARDLPPDECNLLYVAVTRAKQSLILSRTLKSILERSGEKAAQDLSQRLSAART